MPDPVPVLGAALLTGLVVAVGAAPLLRRLPEPSIEELGSERKLSYGQLATPRFVAGVTAISVAATLLSWTVLPTRLQPLWAVLASIGVLLAAVDALTTWLPRRLTYLGWAAMLGAVGAAALLGARSGDLLRAGLGALVAGSLYFGIWAITRRGFGFGDVRFAPLLGAAAGAHSWTLLTAALMLGTVVGAGHGLLRLAVRRSDAFPYAPSMLAGTYLAALIVWGSG